jgi:hypothetical protein
MAMTTIHKRIQFARQFMHDAVDWKIIDENPFLKVKTQKSSVKVNEFVPREVVDKLMKKANPVWKVILGLSRYGGLRTPSETLSLRWEDIDWEMNRMSIPEPKVEHHEGRGIRSCPIFPELRPTVTRASEPAAVPSGSQGCRHTPLCRSEDLISCTPIPSGRHNGVCLLLCGPAGKRNSSVSSRCSVCSWLGNSPRIAQQSYLLVTEEDFAKATGVAKVMV